MFFVVVDFFLPSTATDWYSVSFHGLLRQQFGTLFPFVASTATDWYSVSFRGLLRQQIGTLYGNRLVLCSFSWPSTATDWYSVSFCGLLRQQIGALFVFPWPSTATDWYSVQQQIGTLFLFVAFYGKKLSFVISLHF